MNNILKTILIISIAILGAGALGVSDTQASSGLVVEFEKTPLFGEVNFLPGDDVVRWVKVTNNTTEPENIAVEVINYIGFPDPNNVPLDDLSRALSIIIREQNGNDLYGGSSATGEKTLYNLFQEGERLLTADLAGNGGQIIYDFEISFPIEKANEWQSKTTQFDILVGFQGDEGGVEYCNYDGVQNNGETGVDCGGGGCPACGGGGGGGGGTPIFGLTIIKDPKVTFDPDDPDNNAIMEWMTSYYSTSQVVYSHEDEPHTFSFSAPNYGYAHAYPDPEDLTKVVNHTVVIPGLLEGETYYYRVISHASPPTISREHTFIVPEVKGASTIKLPEYEEPAGSHFATLPLSQDLEELTQELEQILEENKDVLPQEVLDEIEVLLDKKDELDEEDLELNLTASLASIFDNFGGFNLWWILIILLILILIIAIAKLIKDKLEKDKN